MSGKTFTSGMIVLIVCLCVTSVLWADLLTLQDEPGGYQGTHDAYLHGGNNDDENFGGADHLEVALRSELRDSVIMFELLPLPDRAVITAAGLSLYYSDDYQMGSSDWMTVAIYPLRRNWTEGNGDGQGGDQRSGLSWIYRHAWPNQTDTWANSGAKNTTHDRLPSDGEVTLWGNAYGWQTWSNPDVTATVVEWYTGTLANNGWVVDYTATNEDPQGVDFISSDFPDTSWIYHPKLVIDYYVPGKGDLNCDGNINSLDIDPFVQALTNPTEYEQQHPDCYLDLADCNSDGSINSLDIDPFVDLLTDG